MVFAQTKPKSLYHHYCHIHFVKFCSQPSLNYAEESEKKGVTGTGHESTSQEQGERTCLLWLQLVDAHSQEEGAWVRWEERAVMAVLDLLASFGGDTSVTELFALPRSVLHHQLKSSVTKSGFLLSSGLSPVIFIRQEQ